MVGLTLGEYDLFLLWRVRSGSTCMDPPQSWVIWVVNRENGQVEYVERITRNSFHILRVAYHGPIPWSFMRDFSCRIH